MTKFPKRAEYLMEHRHDIVKWKAEDYQKMIEELED